MRTPFKRFSMACLLAALSAVPLALGMGHISSHPSAHPVATHPAKAALTPPVTLSLEKKPFPQGTLYILRIPADDGYRVKPLLSSKLAGVDAPTWSTLATTTTASKDKKPVFVINGGYFDPQNALTTSYVFDHGVITGDPRTNPHLIGNPALKDYLPRVFNRSEFRVYLCRGKSGFNTRYDIALHNLPTPPDCLLQASVGAGPSLLPKVNDQAEAFTDFDASGKLTRDPIGVNHRNARSAVGITEKGDVIIAMGAQNPGKPTSGFSLMDMADLLKARGAMKAISLDGGSSSGLWFGGKTIYGKFNKDGSPVKRPVKSVLVVVPR